MGEELNLCLFRLLNVLVLRSCGVFRLFVFSDGYYLFLTGIHIFLNLLFINKI